MLRFPSPVLRSKPFNALPVSLPVAGPPNALKSFEQAHSVLDASSAKTPKIERDPRCARLDEYGALGCARFDAHDSTIPQPPDKKSTIASRCDAFWKGFFPRDGNRFDLLGR